MSTIKVNSIKNTATNDGGIAIDNSGHVQIDGQQLPSSGPLSNRNLVINGAMNIAQRGTSASVAEADNDIFQVDRFFNRIVGSAVTTYSQSTESPADFTSSLKLDVTTADTDLSTDGQLKIEHRVEGLSTAFLKWGTSHAKTVTLSFWIKSNLTGNTQVALVNLDNNRNYIATFTIDSANTWEQKILTVAGDTGGTWHTGNDTGIRLRWGSFGTQYQTGSVNQWVANATQLNSRSDSPINFASSTDNELYLTGVQLEVGEKATPFEHRSFGDELAKCQRYYFRVAGNDANGICHGYAQDSNTLQSLIQFPNSLRKAPTALTQTGTASDYSIGDRGSDHTCTTVPTFISATKNAARFFVSSTGNLSAGDMGQVRFNAANRFLAFDVEL